MIALTGIALGIAVLVVVTALMDGYRRGLYDRFSRIYPPILVESFDGSAPLPESITRRASASPARYVPGFLFAGTRRPGEFVQVKATAAVQGLEVGAEIARRLQVKPGDVLRIMVGSGAGRRTLALPLRSVFTSGLYEVDRRWVRIPLPKGLSEGAFFWEVTPRTPDDYASIAALKDRLGPGFTLLTLDEINGDFFTSLKLQEWSMVVVLSIITFVAGFQLVTRLLLDFRERRRTVGILLALGAEPRSIAQAFFFYGAWVGILGILAGAALGAAAALALNASGLLHFGEGLAQIYMIDRIDLVLDPLHLAAITGGGILLVLCISALILPRFRRLDAVEALRFE
jgi:lipoprotein-releasing system permease protein